MPVHILPWGRGSLNKGTLVAISLALALAPHSSVFPCTSPVPSKLVTFTGTQGESVSESVCRPFMRDVWVFRFLLSHPKAWNYQSCFTVRFCRNSSSQDWTGLRSPCVGQGPSFLQGSSADTLFQCSTTTHCDGPALTSSYSLTTCMICSELQPAVVKKR